MKKQLLFAIVSWLMSSFFMRFAGYDVQSWQFWLVIPMSMSLFGLYKIAEYLDESGN